MSPTIPTNFNDTDALIDYGKDIGIAAGVGFLVPAVVFSMILIFVFVKFCGGSGKTRQDFTSNAKLLLIVISAVVLIICIATCAVGWTFTLTYRIYNERIHKGVEDGSVTLQHVILSSSDLMSNVNSTVSSLTTDLVSEIYDQTNPVIQNLTALLVPLDGILGVVRYSDAEVTLRNLTTLTVVIVENITYVKQDIASLTVYQGMSIINNVPASSDVPDVNSKYVASLNSSVNNLNDVVENVKNMTDNVNSTLSEVSDTVTNQLISLTDDYNQKAADALSYITDFQVQISKTNDSYNDYSSDVVHYSSIRKSITTAILVLPLTLCGLAFIGAMFKIKFLLKISAAFCFVFMFWYFLVAGLNFVAYYTLDQVCDNQDEIVTNAVSIARSDITIPGTNITVLVSEKVLQLLKCSGNNTLINIFEFDFLVDDLTDQIETEVLSLTNKTQQLNQTESYQSGIDSLAQMENSSVNLDFLQNASLPRIHEQLTNISTDLNNTINGPEYPASLAAVNNITNNLLLTNGTTIHEYYDETNITTLNCTVDPYDKLDSNTQQDLCAKANVAIQLTAIRNLALQHQADINSNVTDMQERLYGFEAALPTIEGYQNQTSAYATSIRGFLDQALQQATAVIKQVADAAMAIIALIKLNTNKLVSETQCAFLGDAYSSLSDNLCSDVRDSLEIISAMLIIGACMLFVSAIVSMNMAYKLERSFMSSK